MLIVRKKIKREIDPFLIEVSLHGARPKTHERQTRAAGSFETLLNNMKHMRAAGLRLKVNTTLTVWNQTELVEMQKIATSFDAGFQVDPFVSPRDNGDQTPLKLTADPGHLQALGGHAAKAVTPSEEKNDRPHCGAGSSTLAVDPYGNVLPCVQWRRPIGNLHDSSLVSLLSANPELEKVRSITRAVHGVLQEKPADLGFCPGRSELETGSPLPYTADRLQRDDESCKNSRKRRKLASAGGLIYE